MPTPPTSPTMSPRPASAASHHARDSAQRDDSPMQLFVRSPSGETTTLTTPPSTSIAMVKSLIAVQHPQALPSASARLTFAGRLLDPPEKTLADLEVPPSGTLEFALPSRGSMSDEGADPTPVTAPAPAAADSMASAAAPQAAAAAKPAARPAGTPKRRGPRCTAAACNLPAQRIVGECGFCGGNFCGKHRLLESHSCTGLEDAKKADKDRNKARLESERTQVSRGLGV